MDRDEEMVTRFEKMDGDGGEDGGEDGDEEMASPKSWRRVRREMRERRDSSSPDLLSGEEEDVYKIYKCKDLVKKAKGRVRLNIGRMIDGIENWEEVEDHDFLYARGEFTDELGVIKPVFIKKLKDREAFERESNNLYALRNFEYVPIFYCSLYNEATVVVPGGDYFIITELVYPSEKSDDDLLKDLPDHLDMFHSLDYFHGDLGAIDNIMIAIREGDKRIPVFIDLDDTYDLSRPNTKDTEITETSRRGMGEILLLSRDEKISAFKIDSSDEITEENKYAVFAACDRFSLMYSLLSILGYSNLLPGTGEAIALQSDSENWVGCNCLFQNTATFYKVFIPNFKIIITGHECRERRDRDDGLENANVFWDLENTLTLIPLFDQCYLAFVDNLKEGREPFDGIDDILSNSDIRNLRNSSIPAANKSMYQPPPILHFEPEPEPEIDLSSYGGGKTNLIIHKRNKFIKVSKNSKKKRKSKKRKAKKTKNNYKKSKKTRRKIKRKYK